MTPCRRRVRDLSGGLINGKTSDDVLPTPSRPTHFTCSSTPNEAGRVPATSPAYLGACDRTGEDPPYKVPTKAIRLDVRSSRVSSSEHDDTDRVVSNDLHGESELGP